MTRNLPIGLIVCISLILSSCTRDSELTPNNHNSGRLISETHEGIAVTYTYDNDGLLRYVHDPTAHNMDYNHYFTYDANKRLIKEEYREDNPDFFGFSQFFYNTQGNLDSVNQYGGNYTYMVYLYNYEFVTSAGGQLTEMRQAMTPGNYQSRYYMGTALVYDSRGNIEKIIPQNGPVIRYEYDDHKSPYPKVLFMRNLSYLSSNNVVREYRTNPGEPEKLMLEYEYTYTSQGYPKTKIRHNRSTSQNDILYTYEYQ
jgi:YD repeat-containing protein